MKQNKTSLMNNFYELNNELQKLELDLQPVNSFEDLRNSLVNTVSLLITNNFGKLVSVLYRIDVNENRLRNLLKNTEADSASVIADLIIERQFQKIEARKQFNSSMDSEEEK
ncbi:MAG: hypothetical protein C4308_08715 [Chitinophagaceae bacterium]